MIAGIIIGALISTATTLLLCCSLRITSDATEAATDAAAMRRIQAKG